jgi:hypothetical protein
VPSDAPNGKHVGRSWLPAVAEVHLHGEMAGPVERRNDGVP